MTGVAAQVRQVSGSLRPSIIRTQAGQTAAVQITPEGVTLNIEGVSVTAPGASPADESKYRDTVHACVADWLEFIPGLAKYYDPKHVNVVVLPNVRTAFEPIAKRLGVELDEEDLKRLNSFTHSVEQRGVVKSTIYLAYAVVATPGRCSLTVNHELRHVQPDRYALENKLFVIMLYDADEVKTLVASLNDAKKTIRPAWVARIARLERELQAAQGKESPDQLSQRRQKLQDYRDHLVQLDRAIASYEAELVYFRGKAAGAKR
jgi:hypothetical protein